MPCQSLIFLLKSYFSIIIRFSAQRVQKISKIKLFRVLYKDFMLDIYAIRAEYQDSSEVQNEILCSFDLKILTRISRRIYVFDIFTAISIYEHDE